MCSGRWQNLRTCLKSLNESFMLVFWFLSFSADGLNVFAELYLDIDLVFFGYLHLHLYHVLEYVLERGAFFELY